MAAPYSEDLRRKVVQACERGTQSQREVAELFNVSLSFVESLLRQYRRSGGELVPQRRKRGRHELLDNACREQIRRWLQKQPDLTLQELIGRLRASKSIAVSAPTMSRALHQMGLRRKKDTTCHRTRYRAHTSGSAPIPQGNRQLSSQETEVH